MIDVHDNHFRRATGRAAGFDRAGGAVADLEEGHQARGGAAAREFFLFAAQLREIGAGAGAVFEQTRLAHPQIHDAAVIDEIVRDGLDETGVRLRMFVGGLRLHQFSIGEIDIEMALAGAIDAIGPVQAGVEPLRRIGRRHLRCEHEAQFVAKRLRVLLAVEVTALPAPVGPGAGEAVEDLFGGNFGCVSLVFRQIGEGFRIGDRSPEEGGNAVFLDALQPGRHAGLAEIFLGENVAGDLAPLRRGLDVFEREHHRTVRVADFALRGPELDGGVGRLVRRGVSPLDFHFLLSPRGASPRCVRSQNDDGAESLKHETRKPRIHGMQQERRT